MLKFLGHSKEEEREGTPKTWENVQGGGGEVFQEYT